MPARSTLAVALAILVAATTAGCSPRCAHAHLGAGPASAGVPPGTVAAPAKPRGEGHLYQLDFALSSGGAYTMTVEEERNGEIRVGSNIPLSASGGPRQDVGLSLRCNVVALGDDVLLHTSLEMSFVEDPAGAAGGPIAIHKLVTASDTLATPGKPVVVSSVEDPTSHKRHQLTVTATRVR